MPIVQLPDGSTAQFPDSMPQADIEAALKAHTAAPSGVGAQAAHLAKMAGTAVVRGAAAPVQMLGALGDAAGSAQRALGLPNSDIPPPAFVTQGMDKLRGMAEEPQGTAEGMAAGGIKGATEGALLSRVVPGMGALAPNVIAGAAGGAAGDMVGNATGSPVAGAGAGLAAGVLTQLGHGMMMPQIAATIGKALGSSKTIQDAGTALQSAIHNWFDNVLPAHEHAAWQTVDQHMYHGGIKPTGTGTPNVDSKMVAPDLPSGMGTPMVEGTPGIPATPTQPKGPPVNMTNYRKTLEGIVGDPEAPLAGSNAALTPNIARKLLDELNAATSPVKGAASGAHPPSIMWDDARGLRSNIGQSIKNPRAEIQGLPDQQRSAIYAAITADLKNTADAAGAGPAFDHANQVSSDLRTVGERHMAPLIAPDVSPEKAAGMAMKEAKVGGTKLSALRGQIPDAMDEMAAGILQDPNGLSIWSKLSPQAKEHLVQHPIDRSRLNMAADANTPVDTIKNIFTNLKGEAVGTLGGVTAGHYFPIPGHTEMSMGALGGLTGMAIPTAAKLVKGVINSPTKARLPGIGALAGYNAESE